MATCPKWREPARAGKQLVPIKEQLYRLKRLSSKSKPNTQQNTVKTNL